MLLITPWTPTLDLEIASFFYEEGRSSFSSAPLWLWLYDYAVYPAQGVAVLACFGWCISYLSPRYTAWRQPALSLILSMSLGAGLITHLILKDHWGRPRPRQVVQFGGKQPFRPYYELPLSVSPEPSKSFPCGHCTMGFYFFSVALVCRREGLFSLARFFMFLAFLLGGGLGIARIAMGGHFFSDVLSSALIMWITAIAVDEGVYRSCRS